MLTRATRVDLGSVRTPYFTYRNTAVQQYLALRYTVSLHESIGWISFLLIDDRGLQLDAYKDWSEL